jgi:hypothetical protein
MIFAKIIVFVKKMSFCENMCKKRASEVAAAEKNTIFELEVFALNSASYVIFAKMEISRNSVIRDETSRNFAHFQN